MYAQRVPVMDPIVVDFPSSPARQFSIIRYRPPLMGSLKVAESISFLMYGAPSTGFVKVTLNIPEGKKTT